MVLVCSSLLPSDIYIYIYIYQPLCSIRMLDRICFKQSLTGLNSELLSDTSWYTEVKKLIMPYSLLIAGEYLDLWLSQDLNWCGIGNVKILVQDLNSSQFGISEAVFV